MSNLLLNLRDVPEDEANDVRTLLEERGIDYYETRPSPWGISFGGIWVRDADRVAEAKQAFEDYERERSARVRAEYAAARAAGTAETFASQLRAHPLRVALTLLGIVAVLCLVTLPFVLSGH